MIEIVVIVVVGLLVVAGAAVFAPRLGVASPLLLVLIGIAASFTPWLPEVEIDPEWILEGLLPPLLYASAVSMPTMNFRREFRAISSLSVVLVVISSLTLGVLFAWLIPDLGFVWGVALGAILSPTDAVATSIVKQTPVSRRVLVILDGESLLNDASALVLLRTAIVAASAAFSFWGAVGTFAYAVAVAVVIGAAAGWLNLEMRRRVAAPTVNTILSFTVPFIASVPAELLGGSGLVAAVVAGLVTGFRAPRVLPPQHRMSDSQNWASIELVAEGAVFLTMGLQLSAILIEVHHEHTGVPIALALAAAGLLLTLLVRAGYVALVLWGASRRTRRHEAIQPQVEAIHDALSDGAAWPDPPRGARFRKPTERGKRLVTHRVTRLLSDIDYFVSRPLTARDGAVVVWAGMRGAVTVAAAQTLPVETPHRALLVFIAFAVATMSLLVQGGTIKAVVARLTTTPANTDDGDDERQRVLALLSATADEVTHSAGAADAGDAGDVGDAPDEGDVPAGAAFSDSSKLQRIAVLNSQRAALLNERDRGTIDADILTYALQTVDAEQIALEMRGGPDG